jgi:hypothetical protein
MSRKRLSIAVVLFALTMLGLGYVFMRFRLSNGWLTLVAGLLFAAVAVVLGKLTRFVVGAILLVAASILLALSEIPFEVALTLFLVFLGLLAIGSGAFTLRRLLRQPADSEPR